MKLRGRLFTKYVALIVALVSFVLIVSSAISLYFSSKENVAHLGALQREKAIAAATRIELYLTEIEHQMAWTALPHRSAGGQVLEQYRYEYLKLLRQAPAILDLVWVDADGKEQLRVSRLSLDRIGAGTDYSGNPAFKAAVSGRIYYGPVYFRKETEPYMTIARPAGAAGKGVIVGEVNLKFVWDVITKIEAGNNGVAYVVDSAGTLIAHPNISLVLQKTDLSRLPQVAAGIRPPDSSGDSPYGIARDLQANEVLSAHAPIPTLDWLVFVELPLKEAFAPLYGSIQRSGYLLLAGLVLSVLASLYLATRMVRPIRALQDGAARIGAGKLDQRIDVSTGDELEALGDQFNSMAGQLRDSYADLERKVDERTRQLSEALVQLEVANRHKSEFLASMSHELRTPLNAIIGFSDVLIERMCGELNEQQDEYLRDIHSSGEHLLALINDILDLSKVEAGRMELDLARFDLETTLRNAMTFVRALATRHGIALSTDLAGDLGEFVADERKVKQVLLNLLSNAVKFTPDGGKVTVSAQRLGSVVTVSVSDTGIGIAEADRAVVFEEFRQVGHDTTKKSEGTGLGLALARKFVELHGGTIRVEGRPEKGSIFTFTLVEQRMDPA
jgi:signal transduction histidine kinase